MDSTTPRLVIVTGANRGLGYHIIKLLCELNTSKSIILTCRTLSSGQAALDTLKQQFPSMKDKLFLEELDINHTTSVNKFVELIKTKYGKFDVLVNNAGVACKTDKLDEESTYEDACRSINTNFLATVELTEKLLPLLSDDGKVLQISSLLGRLEKQGLEIRKVLSNPDIDRQTLIDLANKYLEGVKTRTNKEMGFSNSGYYVSKTLLNKYTRSVLRKLAKPTQQLYYYSPGWCRTDMGGEKAVRSPEQGVDCAGWLIELPFVYDEKLDSKFIFDRKVIDD